MPIKRFRVRQATLTVSGILKGFRMSVQRLLLVLMIIVLLMPFHACTDTGGKEQPTVFKQIPEIQEIKSQKPVKIKLKRNAKGEYSWDISGSNPEKIIEADKKFRETYGNKK